jgi:hypothetical protein
MDTEPDEPIPMEDSTISAILQNIEKSLPKVPKRKLTRDEIAAKAHLNVPIEFKQKYIDILYKHQQAISVNKYDLGLATNFKHKIHLKDNNPVYRKQFKIPEAHQNFIEQSLDEWLKLGVVKRANSLYNSPIFCVPKKQGQGLRVVQDFRELNNHSHIDKYSMKEITECIGDIGRANSTIFLLWTSPPASGKCSWMKSHSHSQPSPFQDKVNTSGSLHPWVSLAARPVFKGSWKAYCGTFQMSLSTLTTYWYIRTHTKTMSKFWNKSCNDCIHTT